MLNLGPVCLCMRWVKPAKAANMYPTTITFMKKYGVSHIVRRPRKMSKFRKYFSKLSSLHLYHSEICMTPALKTSGGVKTLFFANNFR